MDSKQNPFSLYDFLGYFTPGAVFLYVSMAISDRFLDFHLHHTLKLRGFTETETYVGLVLLAYILGHTLSFLSSAFVEKFSNWMHGYPSKYLLNISHPGYLKVNDEHGKPKDMNCELAAIRIVIWIFMFPVAILDFVLGKHLNARNVYVRGLDAGLTTIIKGKIDRLLKDNSGLTSAPSNYHFGKDDFFRFTYHYALVNSEHHIPSLKNYVALYGFTRTMTLMSVLIFWGCLLFYIFSKSESHILNYMLIASIPISYIYYMAFNKFNRRFTLEVLMAIAVIYKVTKRQNPNKYTSIP